MKKIVALVLALVMVLSLSTMAFAAKQSPAEKIVTTFQGLAKTLEDIGSGLKGVSGHAKNVRDYMDKLDGKGALASPTDKFRFIGLFGSGAAALVDTLYQDNNIEKLTYGAAKTFLRPIKYLLDVGNYGTIYDPDDHDDGLIPEQAKIKAVEQEIHDIIARGAYGLAGISASLIEKTEGVSEAVSFGAGATFAAKVLLPITRTVSNVAHDVYRFGGPIGNMLEAIGGGMQAFWGSRN